MKIIKIIIVLVLCVTFSLSFTASAISESEFFYPEKSISVVFDTASVLSAEQKQFIADKIVLGESIVDDGVSTYALCWLTGHDIVNELVTVVEHKVSTTIPRCKDNLYDVETCSKCDYLEYTLISSNMIFCCPEE